MTEEKIAETLGVSKENVVVKEQGNEEPTIVELSEEERKKFEENLNSDALSLIKRFIEVSRKKEDELGEFKVVIDELEKLIQEKDAPWYNPLYVAIVNFITVIVYYNTHKLVDEDEYNKFMDSIITNFRDLINKGLTEIKTDIFQKYPIEYSTKEIILKAEKESGVENMYEHYQKYAESIRKQQLDKQAEPNRFVYLVLLVDELVSKDKKQRGLFNKLLIDALPNKYRLKQPKRLKTDKVLVVGEKLYYKYQKIDKLLEKYDNIPEDIVKLVKVESTKFMTEYQKKLLNKMISSDKEMQMMQKELNKLAGKKVDLTKDSEEEIIDKLKNNSNLK